MNVATAAWSRVVWLPSLGWMCVFWFASVSSQSILLSYVVGLIPVVFVYVTLA